MSRFTLLLSILLLTLFSAYAQENNALLTIKNDSANIQTESLSIDIQVTGNIATTTVAITFFNPLNRILEGELNFPLAEGQQVYRFAMDVNGKLREAVVVDKGKGTRTFEKIVRQGIDPGLLEMTAGNNYKARVYPIPAKGRKSILIAYEEQLTNIGDAIYNLTMKYGGVGNFKLNVEVLNPGNEPQLIDNALANFRFEKWNSVYKATYESANFCACVPLKFSLPTRNAEQVFVRKYPDANYFFITYRPEPVKADKKLPKSIILYWDASHSGRGRDLKKEMELLDRYLSQFSTLQVRLISFSNTIHQNKVFNINNGQWNLLQEELQRMVYDGGTNPTLVDFEKVKADEVLLFTDGIFNLDEASDKKPKMPVYAINSNPVSNHSWLRKIANESGGAYINLVAKSLDEGYSILRQNIFQFISAEYSPEIKEVYPSIAQPITGTISIAGKSQSKYASITLNFGSGGVISVRKKFDLSTALTSDSELKRVWATMKIEELSIDAQKNRSEITSEAVRYSIVTPYTSLIVLDRLEDYLLYEITPPQELLEEYKAAMAERNEDKEEFVTRDQIMQSAIEKYSERTEWWKTNVKYTKPKTKPATEVRSQQTQTQPQPESQEPVSRPTREVIRQPSQTSPSGNQDSFVAPTGPFDNRISGIVVDDNQQPLPGVNVLVKGTSIGTVTDSEGNYSLNVPSSGAVIVISFVGYGAQEITVSGSQSTIDAILEAETSQLSEVVVVGYGEQRRTDLTGSFAGRVAGVAVAPGVEQENQQDAAVPLGEHPLYVIDGVAVLPEEAKALLKEGAGEVNIIRSANASSIYGSRAADGVVVITSRDAFKDGFEMPDSVTSKFEPGIALKEWNPDAPYMDSLRAARPEERYSVYLRLKQSYQSTPSFYLITGNYFISIGDQKTGVRILSNIAEMELENHELLKTLSYRFVQLDEIRAAITLLKKVADIRSEEPQSYRDLALAYRKNKEYQKALDAFMKVIEMDGDQMDWDRFPGIKNIVIDEVNQLIAAHGKVLDLSNVPKALIAPQPVDLRIILDWNALETDIDLWVTEPDGTQCSYKNRETGSGGYITDDFTEGYGPEVYMIKHAQEGKYKIAVDYFDERQQKVSGPVTLQVTIVRYFGTTKEERKQFTVQLENEEEKMLEVGEVGF
jgi:tetratricopeptide (TPR) repeat protein